jgi:hypothetical protein
MQAHAKNGRTQEKQDSGSLNDWLKHTEMTSWSALDCDIREIWIFVVFSCRGMALLISVPSITCAI